MVLRSTLLLISLLLFAAIIRAQSPERPSRTVWSGIYSNDQAARGEAQFQSHCSECHDGDLDPRSSVSRLLGDRFMDRWREEPLTYLFTFVSTSMPRRAPASLTKAVYVDILAYLFRSNSFPPGSTPLAESDLGTIRMEHRDGPRPLPGGSFVQLAGCLTVDPDEVFFLTNATEPVRARRLNEMTAEELSAAEAQPLGELSFRLANFEAVGKDFRRLEHIGHKMLAKGTLIRQLNRDRINLTAMKMVDSQCDQF